MTGPGCVCANVPEDGQAGAGGGGVRRWQWDLRLRSRKSNISNSRPSEPSHPDPPCTLIETLEVVMFWRHPKSSPIPCRDFPSEEPRIDGWQWEMPQILCLGAGCTPQKTMFCFVFLGQLIRGLTPLWGRDADWRKFMQNGCAHGHTSAKTKQAEVQIAFDTLPRSTNVHVRSACSLETATFSQQPAPRNKKLGPNKWGSREKRTPKADSQFQGA